MTTRIKKSLTAVPETIAAAASYLASIAKKQHEINKLSREAKAAVTQIEQNLKAEVSKLERERDTFFNNLFAFAKPIQQELTKRARSIKTIAGTFGWRWTTPRVELTGSEEALIKRLLANLELSQYVRVSYALDKEAMLAERPEIAGVTYTQREEFFATPKMPKGEGRGKTVAVDV